MKRLIHSLAIVIVVISIPSFAADFYKESERTQYDRELEKLKTESPKKFEEIQKGSLFIAQLALARLGYGIGPINGVLDEKTKSALRTYEKNRNIPQTGDPLSFDTARQLETDLNAVEYQPIGLPSLNVLVDFWEKGYVTASGTWILINDKMGEPEQTSKIICSKSINTCTETTAIVRGKGGDRSLFVDFDTYEIERWDDHEIVTKPLQTPFGCVRYIRRINRLQKTVTGLRSTISDSEMCKGTESKEMYMVLSDGFDVYWNLLQERNNKWRKLLNATPGFIQYLERNSNEK